MHPLFCKNGATLESEWLTEFLFLAKTMALEDAERRKEIDKEKGERQAQQAKAAETEKNANEAAAIAAVSDFFGFAFRFTVKLSIHE